MEISKVICKQQVLDPHGRFLLKWNRIVLVLCAFAIAWDALFFYIPIINDEGNCITTDKALEYIASAVRTLADLIYVGHMILQFRTGFVSPCSFGRGEVIYDLDAIAKRYMRFYFVVDILAVLPLPQMAVLIPRLGVNGSIAKELLTFVIFTQYIPRVFRIYPLYKEVMRTSGVVTRGAVAGAVLNLLLYVFASHVIGASWYLFSIHRLSYCWHESCLGRGCHDLYSSLYCSSRKDTDYMFNKTYCSIVAPDQAKSLMVFDFGMFYEAIKSEVVQSRTFIQKISLCFWWGLRSLSCFGQNFETSSYVGENLFSTFICLAGLILFSFLFGNIQKYVDTAAARADKMKLKWYNTEKWMTHRSLPDDLRENIRQFELYKWQETRGVDEETVIGELPKDLRRKIKRHIFSVCLDSVVTVMKGATLTCKVPWMASREILDEVCERLKTTLYLKKNVILRQGDPVKEVIFIMRGTVICTTNIASVGSFTVEHDGGGYFGTELVQWMADPMNNDSPHFPKSCWTIKSKTEVEAFIMKRDDLRFLIKHLLKLHGEKYANIVGYYSELNRTWAAYRIQVEWKRCRQKATRPVTAEPRDVTVVVEETSFSTTHL